MLLILLCLSLVLLLLSSFYLVKASRYIRELKVSLDRLDRLITGKDCL